MPECDRRPTPGQSWHRESHGQTAFNALVALALVVGAGCTDSSDDPASAAGGTSPMASGGATGGAGQASAGTTGDGTGTEGEAGLHWVGRVDLSDPADIRCAWPGCGVVARFEGTNVSVKLGDTQLYTVVIDHGTPTKLTAISGNNVLAADLGPGTHVVELYRRNEPSQGESHFLGFDFGAGRLLAPEAPPSRRLEIVGDSITCGYGNEGADQYCGFSADTENHYLTYGAIAARALGAELSTLAWSGKGIVCNYGDAANSCVDPFPIYYDYILPGRANSQWDFSASQVDAVVINLGTNDFSTDSDPTQEEFEAAYRDFVAQIRARYPQAFILCTIGPLLHDADLDAANSYIADVVSAVNAEGDDRVAAFEFTPSDGTEGYGCDWHPNLVTHERMADELVGFLASTLGW